MTGLFKTINLQFPNKKQIRNEGLINGLHEWKAYWIKELNLKRTSLIFRRIKDENNCPSYITELLTRNSDRHTITSRYAKYNLVCLSYNRETEGGRTFQANGAKLWKSIPLDIRKKDSIGSFKSSVRNFFCPKTLSLVFSCAYLDLDF